MIEKDKTPSFEQVHYLLRPKKQIERKVLIEILNDVGKIINLSECIYIGFGSVFYYDFILFHKYLGLNNLLSLDDKTTKNRFNFNRPYDFIQFENKLSTDYLNQFNWEPRVMMWLDYDKKMNDTVLADLRIAGRNSKKHDILILTLNAGCEKDYRKRKNERKLFFDYYGQYISRKYKHVKYYTPAKIPALLQNVILNIIKTTCLNRNVKFFKLFAFTYRDTAPMFTIGGIFDTSGEHWHRELNNKFIRTDSRIIDINVPILTYKEKLWIDCHINMVKNEIKDVEKKVDKMKTAFGPQEKELKMTEMMNKILPFEISSIKNLKNYIDYYKYYPQYYEGII